MTKIHRLYLSGPVSKGVAESQMVNWANLLKEKGVITDFMVFYHKNNSKKYFEMTSVDSLKGIYSKKYVNFVLIRELTFLIYIFQYFLKFREKSEKIIFQTRSTFFALPLILIKLFFQVKIIYEIRGAGEEGINSKKLKTINNSINDRLMLRISTMIITVSKKLLLHKADKFGMRNLENKTLVVYGAADSRLFHYNTDLRYKKRRELNISDKLVILYIGMLDKPWQIPEEIFRFVSGLMQKLPSIYFLVITPNIAQAKKYQQIYQIKEEDIYIRESPQERLNEFINAADFGLLLRENILVNNVAAPTKFAEYLLGGLPVIISEGVGDYSEFTTTNQTGILIDLKGYDLNEIAVKLKENKFIREQIHKTGESWFSKQRFLDTLSGLYQGL